MNTTAERDWTTLTLPSAGTIVRNDYDVELLQRVEEDCGPGPHLLIARVTHCVCGKDLRGIPMAKRKIIYHQKDGTLTASGLCDEHFAASEDVG